MDSEQHDQPASSIRFLELEGFVWFRPSSKADLCSRQSGSCWAVYSPSLGVSAVRSRWLCWYSWWWFPVVTRKERQIKLSPNLADRKKTASVYLSATKSHSSFNSNLFTELLPYFKVGFWMNPWVIRTQTVSDSMLNQTSDQVKPSWMFLSWLLFYKKRK